MNAVNQAVLELEPEVMNDVFTPIKVTRLGVALVVSDSDLRHGLYCKGQTVTWEIYDLQPKDKVEITSQREGFDFYGTGTADEPMSPLRIRITLPGRLDEFLPLPQREVWDNDSLPDKDTMLVPYTLTLTPPNGEQFLLRSSGAPRPQDPCLVIDRMGDPPAPRQ
jgi:hypothetical protein